MKNKLHYHFLHNAEINRTHSSSCPKTVKHVGHGCSFKTCCTCWSSNRSSRIPAVQAAWVHLPQSMHIVFLEVLFLAILQLSPLYGDSDLSCTTPPRLCLETSVNCSWEIGLHLPSVVQQVCLLVLSSLPLGWAPLWGSRPHRKTFLQASQRRYKSLKKIFANPQCSWSLMQWVLSRNQSIQHQ